jgi:hypothetical protein
MNEKTTIPGPFECGWSVGKPFEFSADAPPTYLRTSLVSNISHFCEALVLPPAFVPRKACAIGTPRLFYYPLECATGAEIFVLKVPPDFFYAYVSADVSAEASGFKSAGLSFILLVGHSTPHGEGVRD